MEQLEQYVKVTEIAKALNISRGAVLNLVRKGILPQGVKLGHSRRWLLSDVLDALQAMKKSTEAVRDTWPPCIM